MTKAHPRVKNARGIYSRILIFQNLTQIPKRSLKSKHFVVAIIFGASLSSNIRAEEGGSGHYQPGAMSSFIDSVPPKETFVTRFNFLNYQGNYSQGQPLPIAGLRAVGVDAESTAAGFTFLWRPPVCLWDEDWSYAMSATIPHAWVEVTANAQLSVPGAPPAVQRTDSLSGLGDIVLMPLMLNYRVNPDFNVNFRVGAYAPTGRYEVGRLANTGKNFWTVEPTLGLMYLGQKNGIEASLFLGSDFNWENPDTDYKSGTQVHADGTLAQHFPLWGGFVGVGVNGFWYEQVTGDSGSGAKFGDFKGRTAGLGPVLSYATKIDGKDVIAEVKWLHEMETRRRLEGDYIWLKALVKF